MRFLLLLALLSPIVLANPVFWWLVGAEIGASPVTAIETDGTPTHSQIGPKSFWPDWALEPDGAKLTVKAWFKPTPPRPETGFGELTFQGDGRAVAAAYSKQLQDAGWTIERWMFRSTYPSLPPRPIVECHLVARRTDGDTRSLSASFGVDAGAGRLHWFAGPSAAWQGSKAEPC